ncbi:energy transducer TonB family protein [Consotaella salsifontis]|uniref:Protein TonB n=1 Tax=Consotaella salsifontis TaxID=1365950 RepID=A0A1T4TE03_9HYPH|nr:TonB family protein [Consotaella salsifontis]SKA38715.1 protein TonB [Consotaella salsifontis]
MSRAGWTIALLASVAVHLGGLMSLGDASQGAMEEGGSVGSIAVAGDSFADAVSIGEVTDLSEITQPAEASETEIAAVEDRVTAPPPDASSSEVAPVERAKETAEVAPPDSDMPATPEAVAPAEVQSEMVPITEAVEAASVEPTERVAEVVDAPLPTPRPKVASAPRRVEKAAPRPTPTREKKSAGRGGRSQADARKASAASAASRPSQAGNAAVSNYPGQVARKLRRSVSAPRGAEGTAIVAFTVMADGGVSGVRLVRGSGSSGGDRAALAAVRRAAPFPPIPAGAGRRSWNFQVPIRFE